VADWRKYYDTVAVSSAIYHLFETNPNLGRFIGVEHKLTTANPNEILTPDITAVYESNSSALLFELKYTLPQDIRSVKDELAELAKYGRAERGWGVGSPIQSTDFVLVCTVEDVNRAVEAVKQIATETQDVFYDPRSFSIWHWLRHEAREGEGKEEMRLQHAYGTTRDSALQKLIEQPAGILVPDEVLMTLRFTNVFVRQKPPVQYTIVLLIQNVFSALPPPGGLGRRFYEVDLDVTYRKANALFPPWWENDVTTVQVKRGWIKEALDTLVNLKLIKEIPGKPDSYSIPIPTLPTKKPLQDAVCQKLVSLREQARQSRGRPRVPGRVPKRRPSGVRQLTEFLGSRQ
jgi:hypothetical protein